MMMNDIQQIIATKENIRVACYLYYGTDLLPKGKLKTRKDAEPIFKAMKKIFPELKISKYYIDNLERDIINRKSELSKLQEDCKSGKYDMVVFPSIYSLRNNALDVIREIRIFRQTENPPLIYFLLEDYDSLSEDFETYLHTIVFGRLLQKDYLQKKKKFYQYLK